MYNRNNVAITEEDVAKANTLQCWANDIKADEKGLYVEKREEKVYLND